MNKSARFKHYPDRPAKLTVGFVSREFKKLIGRIEPAENSPRPDKWLKLFADWNELKSYVGSEATRAGYNYSRDMNNKTYEAADTYFREKISPATAQPEHQLMKSFLASRWRGALEKHYGKQLVAVYESDVKPSDPINTALGVQEGRLSKKYESLIAKASVKVRGETMTLWKTRSFMESPDEALRKEAYLANRVWFLSKHDVLADIYDKLVALRQQMAKNVGYKNYVALGYESMGRTDYDERLVKQFREAVKKYAVPLNRRLAKTKADALGKPILRPWDSYDPLTSLPLGIAPIENQLASTQDIFNKLSPALGKHFKKMRELKLIDLENRPGKRSGAYCTNFSDDGKVVIFCNSTGNAEDISTLTHEMGHAFQAWESQHIEAVDLQWGTLDLCEVHSTSMEFLTLPYVAKFFGKENAEKFRIGRWQDAISILCYVSVIDEFQHWVYKNPEATIDERDNMWLELSKQYLAPVDYSGYEKFQKTRWYGQSHIFVSPFYYIDYALAEAAAMQIAMIAAKDQPAALEIFLRLCTIGGTKSFLTALKSAGLGSPFEAGTIKDLMNHAKKELNL